VTIAFTVIVPWHVATLHENEMSSPLEFEASTTLEVANRSVPLPRAKVTFVAEELAGTYVASPALVAVTTQVPTVDAESELPLTAQPVAVPLATV
jgi:hypothetical protein